MNFWTRLSCVLKDLLKISLKTRQKGDGTGACLFERVSKQTIPFRKSYSNPRRKLYWFRLSVFRGKCCNGKLIFIHSGTWEGGWQPICNKTVVGGVCVRYRDDYKVLSRDQVGGDI